jgi:hypothetical protein
MPQKPLTKSPCTSGADVTLCSINGGHFLYAAAASEGAARPDVAWGDIPTPLLALILEIGVRLTLRRGRGVRPKYVQKCMDGQRPNGQSSGVSRPHPCTTAEPIALASARPTARARMHPFAQCAGSRWSMRSSTALTTLQKASSCSATLATSETSGATRGSTGVFCCRRNRLYSAVGDVEPSAPFLLDSSPAVIKLQLQQSSASPAQWRRPFTFAVASMARFGHLS